MNVSASSHGEDDDVRKQKGQLLVGVEPAFDGFVSATQRLAPQEPNDVEYEPDNEGVKYESAGEDPDEGGASQGLHGADNFLLCRVKRVDRRGRFAGREGGRRGWRWRWWGGGGELDALGLVPAGQLLEEFRWQPYGVGFGAQLLVLGLGWGELVFIQPVGEGLVDAVLDGVLDVLRHFHPRIVVQRLDCAQQKVALEPAVDLKIILSSAFLATYRVFRKSSQRT